MGKNDNMVEKKNENVVFRETKSLRSYTGHTKVKKKYKDQNDRIGKIYRITKWLDPFSLKYPLKSKDWIKNHVSSLPLIGQSALWNIGGKPGRSAGRRSVAQGVPRADRPGDRGELDLDRLRDEPARGPLAELR